LDFPDEKQWRTRSLLPWDGLAYTQLQIGSCNDKSERITGAEALTKDTRRGVFDVPGRITWAFLMGGKMLGTAEVAAVAVEDDEVAMGALAVGLVWTELFTKESR